MIKQLVLIWGLAMTSCCWLASCLYANEPTYLSYDEFIQEVEAGTVKDVTVSNQQQIQGTHISAGKAEAFVTFFPGLEKDPLLSRLLKQKHVQIRKAKPQKPFGYSVQKDWQMSNGDTITLSGGEDAVRERPGRQAGQAMYAGEGGRIGVANGKILLQLKAAENIQQIVQSQSKKTLVFLIYNRRTFQGSTDGFGYDYGCLVVVSLKSAKGKETYEARRIMSQEHLTSEKEVAYVRQLGNVDDESKRALLELGRHPNSTHGYTVTGGWGIWDLDKQEVLSKGMPPFK